MTILSCEMQLKISFSVHRDLNVKGQNDKSMDYTLAQQAVGAPPMAFPPGPAAPPMVGAPPARPPAPANGAPFGMCPIPLQDVNIKCVCCDAHKQLGFAVRHVTVYVHACASNLFDALHKQSGHSAKYSAKARGLMRIRSALQLSRLPFLIALCKIE